MRKRTLSMILDKIFYFFLLLLPLFVLFIAFVFNYSKTNLLCSEFLNVLNFDCSIGFESDITYLIFDGTRGYLANIFTNVFVLMFGSELYFLSSYCQYIVCITLIHILVDVILLLPRICQKFLSKVGGGDVG